ncbi:MAG: hypothetical protein HY222_03460 [Thaumarchaeota archaeon]|nr:hypothetical protein [Nitrososphaerota archaeon]MBI3641433.1 hypothetical protein [Nitrososphaerota archaeon]
MPNDELSKKFAKIDERLIQLEKAIFSKKKLDEKKPSKYTGLSGGIRLLIENRFFDSLRELNEIILELKKKFIG